MRIGRELGTNGRRGMSEEKSDASRTSVHRRMDEIVDRVSKVELISAAVQDDVRDMMPVTEDVKRWKLMGLGALGLIGIGGMVLGVLSPR
ncbi:hypothetical protein B5K06_25720 [Rhizobium grahamii]|uniref:Uncharacterized protein n=2 Tax=Rhizobium grahamii TaxID=1120045 RepID=A0A370KIX6_9HYPH|nr:hypothetical protein B5K06_25720 [Rhizobium grahamii]